MVEEAIMGVVSINPETRLKNDALATGERLGYTANDQDLSVSQSMRQGRGISANPRQNTRTHTTFSESTIIVSMDGNLDLSNNTVMSFTTNGLNPTSVILSATPVVSPKESMYRMLRLAC